MGEIFEVIKTTFAYIGFVQTSVLLSLVVWTLNADRVRNNRRARKVNRARAGRR